MKTICYLVENNAKRKIVSIRHIFPDVGKYLSGKDKNCLKNSCKFSW